MIFEQTHDRPSGRGCRSRVLSGDEALIDGNVFCEVGRWAAAEMKRRTNAPSAWTDRRLHTGAPHAVTIRVKAFESRQNEHSGDFEKFIERFTK